MSIKDRMYNKISYDEIRFYQLPKMLFEQKIYSELSLGAKVCYAIMRDRQELSIKNKWLDKNGFIYFYFDCRELAKLMGVSTFTTNKYKRQLIQHELLYDIRQGLNKPNKMYVLKPVIERSSENHYTSVAEITTQDLRKSLQSDTDIKDTEYNDTKKHIHHFLQNDGTQIERVIKYYCQKFENIYGRNHWRITQESFYDLCSKLEEKLEVYDYEDMQQIIHYYFNNKPDSSNGNILAFINSEHLFQ